jgi:hypothetical protein
VPYGTDSRLVAFQAINCLATIISPFGTTNPLSTFSKPHQSLETPFEDEDDDEDDSAENERMLISAGDPAGETAFPGL